MSMYSGEYDLFDHIMSEKMYDMGKFKVSDELECFNVFKARTGGVIHQHKEIRVAEYNQDFVEKHCPEFKVISHTKTVKDKRLKAKEKEVTTYTYEYYGKEYSNLKELNNHKIYITVDIHFDTLLDIIPYYPYLVKFAGNSNNRETIYITNESQVESERNNFYSWGNNSAWEFFTKRLQEHYLEVCEKYFLYKIGERTKQIPVANYEKYDENYYKISLDDGGIDYMHSIKYVWKDDKKHTHWAMPEMLDDHTLLLHKDDVEVFLAEGIEKGTVMIEYVENCDFPKDYE